MKRLRISLICTDFVEFFPFFTSFLRMHFRTPSESKFSSLVCTFAMTLITWILNFHLIVFLKIWRHGRATPALIVIADKRKSIQKIIISTNHYNTLVHTWERRVFIIRRYPFGWNIVGHCVITKEVELDSEDGHYTTHKSLHITPYGKLLLRILDFCRKCNWSCSRWWTCTAHITGVCYAHSIPR